MNFTPRFRPANCSKHALENYIGNDANRYATVANETLNHNPHQGADVHDGDFRGVGGAGLVAWHSGRTSVSGRRTFPVLRLTCS